MKRYEREKYILEEYTNEKYILIVFRDDDDIKMEKVIESDNWEELYVQAKKEAEKGNTCEILERKFLFKS